MMIEATSDLWWRNAIVYCLDVETFADGNGDGCGDFTGLTRRIDHLAGLGVTCVWLMPFQPTPDLDDGYDLTDYYSVDPRLGSLGDFVEFVRTAQDRGIRVIADLIVNHTSDQHPWFRAARSDPSSPYREFYVWRDEPGREPEGLVFPDAEDSVWAYDEVAGQYYLHMFYAHQPDLNINSPVVRDEIAKVAGFWLRLGLSGFRVDAVPFFVDEDGFGGDGLDVHDYLRDLRRFIARRAGAAVLLGEVNLEPQDQRRYFGDDGDELHMLFNFNVMQALYLGLVRGDARPVRAALTALPDVPADAQWGNFIRNHDELTLDKLTDDERQEVFAALGPDEHMQLFGRGLRRRLPPMVEGDQRRIRMMYSLLFALPGTPVLFYGEEIGMGENLDIEGRLSVRTPMQWTAAESAGFSTAAPEDLCMPLPDGAYGPEHVNVADQRRDTESLLNWMERAIRRRRECPEIGWGEWRLLETDQPAVLAHRCDWHGRTVVALHNLGADAVTVDVADGGTEDDTPLEEVFADGSYDPWSGGACRLEGFGYRWFQRPPTPGP